MRPVLVSVLVTVPILAVTVAFLFGWSLAWVSGWTDGMDAAEATVIPPRIKKEQKRMEMFTKATRTDYTPLFQRIETVEESAKLDATILK